jgi:hypothetical protein
VRDFGPAFDRIGSFSSKAIKDGGRSMSAVPPIAPEFYAPQRTTPSARSRREQSQQKAYYSIISSARPEMGSGTVMPSVLAVLKFRTRSTFAACSTELPQLGQAEVLFSAAAFMPSAGITPYAWKLQLGLDTG